MPRLFISHSSRDNVYALAFQNWLTANGWASEDVFVDLHGIGAGERWRDTLRKANAACEAVVLLASPDSLGSVECQKELELAEVLGKEIILAIIRDLTRDSPLLARYSERQFVDLSAFPQDHVEALEYDGRTYRVAFNPQALAAIKERLDDLGIAPGSFAWPPKGRPNAAPYPGLAAFGEDDAGIFFGREADIMTALAEIRLVRRRRGPRLIVIDAASGSGKSSFLRAGLWPRLRRDPDFAPLAILRPAQGVLSGPDGLGRRLAPWFERHGRPKAPGTIHTSVGAADDAAGAAALARLIAEATELATETRRAAAPDAKPPALLIAIDQAEELFGSENDAESRRLLGALAALLAEPPAGSDPYVLATIRADSVQSLLVRVAELGLETPKVLYLPPLSPAAYREVILRPAEVYSERVRRLAIEPALAQALVQDATGADALPLLAFSLGRLFTDYAAEGELTLAQYRQMGGASGSIARALKEAQARAGAAGSDEALRRLIVPRLATWDPDADQHKGATKRLVASWSDVAGGDRAGLARLAEALIEARLLTRSADALEVAHEALLRQPPISDWLAEDRDFLMWRDRLGRARAQFDANERGLLVGRELQIARDWLNTRAADMAPPDRSFIEASAAEDDRRRSAEERTERERQAAALEASRRVQRRTAMGLLASLVFALMAAGAWLQASTQRDAAIEANYERAQSRLKYLATSATRAAEDGDTTTGLLLAMEAMPDANGDKGTTGTRRWWSAVPSRDAMFRAVRQLVLPEDEAEKIRDLRQKGAPHLYGALRGQRELAILRGHTATINRVAMSPDGALIVTGSGDRTARIWDAKTGAELLKLEGHSDLINSVAVVPSRSRVVTGSADRTARVWDAKTGKELLQLKGHTGAIVDVAASEDGTRIVTGSEDKTARIWNAETGAELLQLEGHTGSINGVTVMPGDRVVTGSSDNTARVWDAKTGKELLQLKGHDRSIFDVATSADGTRIVTGSDDKTARVWDAKTGKELHQLKGHSTAVNEVAVSRDGTRIVTGSQDARVWDAATGAELFKLKGHTGIVWGIAVTPDGSRIVTGSEDGTARIWSAKAGPELFSLKGHTSLVWGVAMTPDGSRVVTGAWGREQARIWDAKTGAELLKLRGHGADVNGVAVSTDGTRVATSSDDRTARIWDLETGAELLRLQGHTGIVYAVAFSSDGARIATGSGDKTARIWDAKTGMELRRFTEHKNTVFGVAFSPDGAIIVTGSADNTAHVWDAKTGEPLLQLKGHTASIAGVAVTPDGARIVTVSGDRTARIWDAKTGKELLQLKGHDAAIRGVALTADGARIVTGSDDRTARIWDAKTGEELFQFKGHTDVINGVALSPAGDRIVTASSDQTARIWETFGSVEAELHHAKGNAPRCLTPGERQRYDLPSTPPPWCRDKWPYDPVSVTILGKKLFESGSHDEANSLFASARDLARDPAAAKRIDEAWAGVLLDRGRNLARSGKDEEAKALFDQAQARDPAVAKSIDGTWAEVLLDRGSNLARDGKDEEAKTVFTQALARDPTAANRIDQALARALLDRGRNLARNGKDKEAKALFDQAQARDPAVAKSIDGTWADVLLDRGSNLARDGKDEEAKAVFTQALARDPTAANRIDQAWARAWLDRGSNLLRNGKDTEAKALFDQAQARDPAVAKRIDGTWADVLVDRGSNLARDGKDEEAKAVFTQALARDPTAAKRIDQAWARALLDRGSNLVRDGNDTEAKAAFDQARARDPATAERIDEGWVDALIERGSNLVRDGKDTDAKAAFDQARTREPTVAKRIDEAWVDALLERGSNLVRDGKDTDAKAAFDQARAREPAVAKRIDEAWVDALLDRGRNLARNDEEEEAKTAFAQALTRNPAAAKRIDAAWVNGFLDRGWNLVNAPKDDDATPREKKLQDALVAFDKAIARSRGANTGNDHMADALFGRGQAHDGLKRYTEAGDDFRAAARLGKKDAESWGFWATIRQANQMRDQGKLAAALMKATVSYLDLTPELKQRIQLRDLKSHVAIWTPMARLHVDLVRPTAASPVTDCDRKVAHPDDPFRTWAATPFDKVADALVDAQQVVAACDLALASHPNQLRYRFQKGRALSKVARITGATPSQVKEADTAAAAEFQAAAAGGYPIAFNNLALAFQRGEGAPKNEEKAYDLYLEGFNRIVHCCWEPVARHLLAHENEHGPAQVRRVVHELTLWARALGSEPARQLLNELYAKGTLAPPSDRPDEKAAFNALPPWLAQVDQVGLR